MGAASILGVANLRRKLSQNILVGVALCLSALLFFSSLTAILSLQGSLRGMTDSLNAADITLYGNWDADDPETLRDWFRNRPEVAAVTPTMPEVLTSENMSFEGREIVSMLYLAERPVLRSGVDDLFAVEGGLDAEGGPASAPGIDEIWLASRFAGINGIEVGDRIGIPTVSGLYELTVSALVVDPLYNSGMVNPVRAWLAPGQLAFMYPAFSLSDYMLSVRLRDAASLEAVKSAFYSELSFSGTMVPGDLLLGAYSIQYGILGGGLLGISILGLLAALFFISSTIRGIIDSEYRPIGILKAAGFTAREFRISFLIQYGIVCLVALAPGLLLGRAVLTLLARSFVDSVGVAFIRFPIALSVAVTAAVYGFLVASVVLRASGRVGRVNTVQAIRFGAPPDSISGRAARKPNAIRFLAPPLFVGQRFAFLNKRSFVVSVITSVLVVVSVLAPGALLNSLNDGLRHPEVFGMTSADVHVTRGGRRFSMTHETLLTVLREDPDVRMAISNDWLTAMIPGDADRAPQEIVGEYYAGDMDAAGLRLRAGRNPTRPGEVIVAQGTAIQFGLSIGSEFTIFLEGQEITYAVTGLYQTTSNMGQGFRLTYDAALALNPLIKPSEYYLFLREGVDPYAYVDRLETRFGEAVTAKTTDEESGTLRSIIGTVSGAMFLVGFVFFGVLFVMTFNSTVLSLREHGRSLGLLKTTGFTPLQLRLALVWKSLLAAACSLLVGLPLSIALGPLVLWAVGGTLGNFSFEYVFSPLQMLLVAILLAAISAGSAWLSSGRVRALNPRILVKE